jgi:peptide/nickel transport system permease protein
MTVDITAQAEAAAAAPIDKRRSPLRAALLGTREGRIGVTLAVALLFFTVGGKLWAPATSPGDALPALGPSADHWLGTDALGRDVFDRVAAGGVTVLLIPFVATTLALLLGGGIAGLLAGTVGGRFDSIVTKVLDVMLTVPPILIVLFVIGILGSSNAVLIITVAVIYAPQFGRIIRGTTQAVRVNLYVAAAQSRGERVPWIVFREILPNTYAPVLATYALNLTYAILFVTGLSFLGLGVQPPNPDWGLMISENRPILAVAPLSVLAPALAITVLAISINLMADAIAKEVTQTSLDRAVVM